MARLGKWVFEIYLPCYEVTVKNIQCFPIIPKHFKSQFTMIEAKAFVKELGILEQ